MEIRISDELNAIINFSRDEAMRTGSYSIAPDHIFLGIIRHRSNTAADVLTAFGINLDEMKGFIDKRIFTNEHIPFSDAENVSFSRGAHNVLSLTVLEATRCKSAEASSQHLLLALCRNSGSGYGQTWLTDNGIGYNGIFSYMEKAGMLKSGTANDSSEDKEDEVHDDNRQSDNNVGTMNIEDFGFDITRAAAEGKLDPVEGRDKEIMRVIQILGRRKKNNPMLVGDPGVGKSAIVEGIAQKIINGDIPPSLSGKRIISLDIASIVAGTKYRGDFEKRLKSIIKEVSENPDIILFIDEFHTIVGAGSGSGSLDAANMLKPALARGEIQCIGATTLEEFSKVVEKDGALDRRFQKIIINPADLGHTIGILKKIEPNYASHHQVTYSPEAIDACAQLSDRYISDRKLPDKAIDAMDEAGSMVRLRCSLDPSASSTVSAEDVATVISTITGIPVNKVAESEGFRLLKMQERLKERIIGQDEAIEKIVKAIQRNRAGLKDPGRPIGSFIFFGPTGVGKTQLAKTLAANLFESESNMIRLDMSEYMEKFTVSRLIGAPPGYVGFEEGGQLSEQVRRKPYCVVLLDEIEKAHPDIFNLLLQILDEGRLTDSNGRNIDFRNTILIMTSNVGSREVAQFGNGIGFSTSSRCSRNETKDIVEKAVRKVFPPEFINRVDEQLYFNSLTREDMSDIIDIELKSLKERVAQTGFNLTISPAAKKFITDAGYDKEYGARPLKRAIQKYVEDPVSEFIILQRMTDNSGTAKVKNIILTLSKNKENTEITCK